ncbi:MAG: tail fiber domain-containing protein [Candidatus Symbiothrix sp.]|jgi:hypothetical protein|nr:tail fiber domain-containing protein [Candidatus Symbiothrix sp.]
MKRTKLLLRKVLITACLLLCLAAQAQIEKNAVGNVGFGTTPDQSYKVRIFNSYYPALSIQQDGQAAMATLVTVDYPMTDFIRGYYPDQMYFAADVTGVYASAYYTISDWNFKQNIENIQSPLSKVLQLRGVSYQLKPLPVSHLKETEELTKWMDEKYSKPRIGVIAQEIEKIVPEVVLTNEDGRKSVAYGEITGLLIEAIKEQQQLIDRQQEQIEELQSKRLQIAAQSNVAEKISATPSIVSDCRLEQNAPNPFSQATTIKYSIADKISAAFIGIYDLQGKQLKQYPVQQRGAGSLIISGSEFPAGIYYYALIADGQKVDIKQMILTE